MPKLIFTQEEINAYITDDKSAKHKYYDDNIKSADRIRVHADGLFPESLIRERRPNEPLEVLEYRAKIFVAKTKPAFSKVFTSLQKIRRSSEWTVKYPDLKFPKVNEEETLEKYCEENYPFFTSVTNWSFDVALRVLLIDPNAVGFVYPPGFGLTTPENEVVKPVCEIFTSENIIDFVPNDYAVLKIESGTRFNWEGKQYEGNSYYIITTKQVLRYDEFNAVGGFKLALEINHDFNELPVFQIRGIVIDHCESGFQFESRIAAMLPELDEAIREYSDLQAVKVLHQYPERWEFEQHECPTCKGIGRQPNPEYYDGCNYDADVVCHTCRGIGFATNKGPYSVHKIHPVKNASLEGISQVPTPPIGYVEKDSEIIKIQEESVRNHIYNAYSAVNCEFLAEVPLSTSGVSKSFDRDESNNWAHSIAEDLIAFIDNTYKFIGYWRYKELYPFDEIMDMMPMIPVPEKYDLAGADAIQEELTKAKQSALPALVLKALQEDFTSKRFSTEPEVLDRLQLILKLDPLSNISEDDKMTRLSNRGITLDTYIISSNIDEFIQRAIEEDKSFAQKPLKDQKAKMKEYAKEVNQPAVNVNDIMEPEETIADYGV